MADKSPWIVDATAATFERDILERSKSMPVVVDFWAPWCGPCRQLGPTLEKLAQEYDGQFLLAKVNIDEEQNLAMAFGVQSIPLVVALRDGQPVDQFMGLLPEEQIREWLTSIMPSETEVLVAEARAIEADDPAGAESKYRQALEKAPKDASLKIDLARVLVAQDRDDEARKFIEELEARGFLEPEAEKIKAQLDLETVAEQAGGVEEARKAAEADPDDLSLQLKLADALAVAKRHEEALQLCLQLIEKDKAGIGKDAKDTMVKIFEVLGPESELVGTYRRKLATLLY